MTSEPRWIIRARNPKWQRRHWRSCPHLRQAVNSIEECTAAELATVPVCADWCSRHEDKDEATP